MLAADNSSAAIHCIAAGQPIPTLTWFRRTTTSGLAQPVPRSAVSSFGGTFAPSSSSSSVAAGVSISGNGVSSALVETLADASLLLSALQSDRLAGLQSGTFFCQASNSLGTVRSRDVHVKIGKHDSN